MITLLACPLCSHRTEGTAWVLVVPSWKLAHRTTAKRGVRCAMLTGCLHVENFTKFAIVETPAAEEAGRAWNAEAERLFATMPTHATEIQRRERRMRLGYPDTAPAPSSP